MYVRLIIKGEENETSVEVSTYHCVSVVIHTIEKDQQSIEMRLSNNFIENIYFTRNNTSIYLMDDKGNTINQL